MRKKQSIKRILSTVIFCIVLVGLLYCFELSLQDDIASYVRVQMHEFYTEEDIDTLFLGASPMINGMNISMLEENGKENVFSLATSNQIAIGGYYLLKEAIERHDIKTVVYHTSYVRFGSNNSNVQGNYILLDEMRFSLNKMNFAHDAIGEFAYVDVLSKYQRKKEELTPRYMGALLYRKLTDEEYKNYYENSSVPMKRQVYVGKGYSYWLPTMEKGSADVSVASYNGSSPDWEYLERTIELCQENGIDFILVQLPEFESKIFADVESYQAGEDRLNSIAQKYAISYWNFNEVKKEFLSLEEQHYHNPSHLAKSGSDLFTEFFFKVWNEYEAEGEAFDKYCYENWNAFELDHQRIYGSELIVDCLEGTVTSTMKTVQPSNVIPEYKFQLYADDILLSESGWVSEKTHVFAGVQAGEYTVISMSRASGAAEEYEVIQSKEVWVK